MKKLYTNKRQLKTLIRKYKSLCDKAYIEIEKDKMVNEAITTLLLLNEKTRHISVLCDETIKDIKNSKDVRQFATRIKYNL